MTIKWAGIAKLQEEMGELQCVLGKLQAYPSGEHPDMRYATPLLQRLEEELGDLMAAADFFIRNNTEIDRDAVHRRVEYKTERLERWHANGDGMTGVYVEEKP